MRAGSEGGELGRRSDSGPEAEVRRLSLLLGGEEGRVAGRVGGRGLRHGEARSNKIVVDEGVTGKHVAEQPAVAILVSQVTDEEDALTRGQVGVAGDALCDDVRVGRCGEIKAEIAHGVDLAVTIQEDADGQTIDDGDDAAGLRDVGGDAGGGGDLSGPWIGE